MTSPQQPEEVKIPNPADPRRHNQPLRCGAVLPWTLVPLLRAAVGRMGADEAVRLITNRGRRRREQEQAAN